MKRIFAIIIYSLVTNILVFGQNKEWSEELVDVFKQVIELYPEDSSSLHQFYFVKFPANNLEKAQKHITRLKSLLQNSTQEKYKDIKENLKPLMQRIVNSESVDKSQAYKFSILYSEYDYFRGEGLFYNLITNEENYDLVWESIKIISNETIKDTCYISALINLEKNIRTNVELAESIQKFVIKSIQNNPLGFLDMYSKREGEIRKRFSSHILYWDSPDKDLSAIFIKISEASEEENYKILAKELIEDANALFN
jgi:hypothetical protein